ncbi:MAG: DUF354 domain-containing protein [Christensenellales bacterium]|jgi:predicted glycosyltransferase
MPNIWIHISGKEQALFFSPSVRALQEKRHNVTVSTEPEVLGDAAALSGLSFEIIGDLETPGVFAGAGLLKGFMDFAGQREFDAVMAFPDKNIAKACKRLGLPYITIIDDETDRAAVSAAKQADVVLVPEAVRDMDIRLPGIKEPIYYPGLLEDFYASSLSSDYLHSRLSIPKEAIVCAFSPPPFFCLVNQREDELPRAILNYLLGKMVVVIMLPHDKEQYDALIEADLRCLIASPAESSSAIIAGCDMFVGAGSHMRQAAALSIPIYTYTENDLCAIDKQLIKSGATTLRSAFHYHKIRLEKRQTAEQRSDNTLILIKAVEAVLARGDQYKEQE